ncbi:hypothetical protein B5X24_HaOG214634 [Helicoverpa armigera]|nr:hypothetical protein B5X24_HaOG214634 [Helicoverpa armigera]
MRSTRADRELSASCARAVTAIVRCAPLAQLTQRSYRARERRAICVQSVLALTVPYIGSVLSKMADVAPLACGA